MTADKRFKRAVRARARRTGESYMSARRALLCKHTEDVMTTTETAPWEPLVEVTVIGVQQVEMSRHLVLLGEKDGERRLQVFIGQPDAAAIATALQGQTTRRPTTHDALNQSIDILGGHVAQVVLGHRRETSTFTADVVVVLPDASERHLDWRVSDAVAVAVRCEPRPTILAPASLLTRPGTSPTKGYRIPCPSCQGQLRLAPCDVHPVDGIPGLATADVVCPSCDARHTVQLRPPPEAPSGT